jgi:streptogramin lyase
LSKSALLLLAFLTFSIFTQASVPSFSNATSSSIQPIPSGEIIQFHLPNGSTQPWGITVNPKNGVVWFVEQGSNQIGSFNPATGNFSEYNIPTTNSLPQEIAIDAKGNVWFTELYTSALGELPVGDNSLRQFHLPLGPEKIPCGPVGVTPDNKGDVWLTCEFSNQLDEFFPNNSTFYQFNLPIFYSAPLQIVFDHSGNFWFTAADSYMIGYATVSQLQNGTTNGINEFPPVNSSFASTLTDPSQPTQKIVTSLSTPSQIALSPDGSTLWITEHTASAFDSYNVQTKSLVKYWTSQTHNPNYIDSLPNGIALDNSGNVWIAEHYGNKIAEFNPTTQNLVEYPIPCCSTIIAGTLYLAIAPNGGVWFSEFFGNAIGEVKSNPQTPLPVDFGFSSGSSLYNMTSNGNVTVPLKLSYNGSGSARFNFDISGLTFTGKIQNLSADFSPSSFNASSRSAQNLNLELVSKNLAPGSHYLTVSARDASDNVTYSIILKLLVTDPAAAFRSLLLEGAIIGIVASVVIIGSMVIYFRSRKVIRRKRR